MSAGRAPACTVVDDLGELRDYVGAALGTTAWHRLDQTSIDTFARVTDDEQWIHVDPARAADGPFGTTIAHGFLTLSLCAGFVGQVLEVRNVGMLVNYGLDRVRFPSPVPAGSDVRGHAELLSLDAAAGGLQAVIRMTIEVRDAAKPACVADTVVRLLPRT
ncbi:MaoC family dehydratase [Conexibacter woesei]|uniref:Enoyl-CoA hydratase n=1 Tax=Conexibacter woesei (strain DSM 14684 / CCUG 47730 / CIP 108061 / JCM 11494 / NBRC 100937 / ID131577) TaxID=469383 RepID=D3F3R4_CONWI|nr:MaoC family dehydratase [Conexibacter woesei]ADB52429.1 Enoyl-CoA hydratase [Conexibacter woesei DSM 14684]